jgi:aminobenzoyl-glutamate transport protein
LAFRSSASALFLSILSSCSCVKVLLPFSLSRVPEPLITPLNVYLAVMVGFAQKYQKDAGIGTIVALMLPYTVVLLVLWTLMLILWYSFGLPLGPV